MYLCSFPNTTCTTNNKIPLIIPAFHQQPVCGLNRQEDFPSPQPLHCREDLRGS